MALPTKYELFSTQSVKRITVVVKIDGLADVLTNRPLYTRVLYGDPGVRYGQGLKWGGLRPWIGASGETFRDYLTQDSAMTITQKIEPEQGRGSITNLTLAFVDKGEYMTQLIAPGVMVEEILGREVDVFMGYEETSYPQDFLRVFRGVISEVSDGAGIVTLQISDPNIKRRQELFYCGKTKTTAPVHFKSALVGNVQFTAKEPYGNELAITYTAGGTAGNEAVTVLGNSISVQIQSGVSTAAQIRSAIESAPESNKRVWVETVGESSTPQTAQGPVQLSNSATFSVVSASDFHRPSSSWAGYDAAIKTYIKIDDEWIRCAWAAGSPTQFGDYFDKGIGYFLVPERGARGTTGAPHETGAEVTGGLEIEDNVIDMALKLMLSGWDDYYLKDVPVLAFGLPVEAGNGSSWTRHILLPERADAKRDYGLVEGDWVYIGGSSSNMAFLGKIAAISDHEGGTNRVLTMAADLVKESPSGALLSFMSQYNTYPKGMGLKLSPQDVDVEQHLYVRNSLQFAYTKMRFFITDTETSGKNFIEEHLYRPNGLYSLTRRGRVSVGITKPPIADQNLVVLSADNILDAKNIRPTRSMTGRTFFNEVHYFMDATNDGDFTNIVKVIDSDSLSTIGISAPLRIEARGARTDLESDRALAKIAHLILTRYKRGAVTLQLRVNWQVGNAIEAGDIVAISDEGGLAIANLDDGTRGIGTKLFEVIERTLDMKNGTVTLKLVAGVNADATDRYASIAPSSVVGAGSTASVVVITDSFGAIFVGNEKRKWEPYVGQKVLVRSEDWSVQGEAELAGFEATNPYAMRLATPLSFTPLQGYTVEVVTYPDSADKSEAAPYKAVHAFLSPSVPMASVVSATVFTVAPEHIGKFRAGALVQVHNESYSNSSGDVAVLSVDTGGNTVTLKTALPFTPAPGDRVELIGFPDGGGAYRFI